MATTLVVLAGWCALSLLFAVAYCVWRPFAGVPRLPMVSRPAPEPFVPDPHEIEPVGADVSEFFHSYARQ